MSTVMSPGADPAVRASLGFLEKLVAGYGPRDFAVRAWDGSTLEADAGQTTRFTIVLQHPCVLPSGESPARTVARPVAKAETRQGAALDAEERQAAPRPPGRETQRRL